MKRCWAVMVAGLVVVGCGSEETEAESPGTEEQDAAQDPSQDQTVDTSHPDVQETSTDHSSEPAVDASDVLMDAAQEDTLVDADAAPPDPCALLGLPVRPFETVAEATALFASAADFTVTTTDGPWSLSSAWSGCDSYLLIQDTPKQNAGWPIALWSRDVDTLLAKSPRNVQLLFVSNETDAAAITAALDGLRGKVNEALATMSPEDAAWWTSRIHYVTQPAKQIPGWVGSVMTSPAWGIGIDRFQRIRYIGSYADQKRYDSNEQWFAPNLSMAANEAIYYNFEAIRQARLDATPATVLPVFAGEVLQDPDWAGVRGYAEVTFPDAASMAATDTLEADLALGCVGEGELGDCPAWDYEVNLYLCDEASPDSCDTEVTRWITTYHREGRWVHDISPMLALIAPGTTRRFAFYTQQPYEVSLDLRLSSAGKALRPTQAIPLWTGGDFGPTYNADHPPIVLSLPAQIGKAEIAMSLTGHGGSTFTNCAEFCVTQHDFIVNGTAHRRELTGAGSSDGCMQQVVEGTVPNQYGTWWYGRSGWCPGREVPMVTIDVTSDVVPGQDNTFTYEAWYMGSPHNPSGANIHLTSWLILSE